MYANGKMRPTKFIPGMGEEGRIKENGRGGDFKTW
jgi:hypothetical protein